MIKLVITGNIASGKSLTESFLQEEGIITVDTDEIVHELLSGDSEIIEKVNNLFDIDVKDAKGKIDRKKVGNIVFNDKDKLERLEKIIHPAVKKIVEDFFVKNKTEKIVAVSVPQLYEAGWESFFDYVLFIAADDEIRIERLMKRNNLSEKQAETRLKAQISQEEKAKRADFVIDNSGETESVRMGLKKVLEKLEK